MSVASSKSTDIAEPQQLHIASFRRVLRNRNFLLLWLAQFISLTVFNATNFVVVALTNDTTHSVLMSGLAIISFTLPAVPFSAIAGVIVDHLDKRRVLWVTNFLRMITMLLIGISLLVDPHNMWPLFALNFLASFVSQFFLPAEGSAIPILVGESELMPALSLFNISLTLSMGIGFLILGRIMATLFPAFVLRFGSITLHLQSVDTLFIFMAFLYAICAILIACIPAPAFHEEHVRRHKLRAVAKADVLKAIDKLWQDMVEGWRIVRADRLLFFSVVQFSVIGVITLLIGELAATFVQQYFHRPANDMSLILAPAGIGLVIAAILIPRIAERINKVRLTVIGFISLGIGFLLLPVCQWITFHLDPKHGADSQLFLLITIVIVFLLGVAMSCVQIPTQTIMQERAPDAGRARVLAFQFMLYSTGSIPVLLFAAAIAQFFGTDPLVRLNQLIVIVAVCMLLFCWWGYKYVGLVGEERSKDEEISR